MRVVLSTLGRFHSFDLARELQSRNALTAIFTAYPRIKLKNEQVEAKLIHTYPWVHAPYMGFRHRAFLGDRANRLWEYLDRITLDHHVSRRLPSCDVFVGLSGSALKSGMAAQQAGAKYVCDRGSSHIREQDRLLREENSRWEMKFSGIDPRIIDREEAEYAAANCITVPSSFNVRSFVDSGVPTAKVHRLSYGVDLERFHPTVAPENDRFDVLFVGAINLRKGIPYLLQAYQRLRHPKKSLTFAGTADQDFIDAMKRRSLWPPDAKLLGHVPQDRLKDLMSASHVLVLPSIEEGMAMVQAQAMACGCPVIGTINTGAEDLFEDGKEGFIVNIREPDAIADRLQCLADDTGLRAEMSACSLLRVRRLGGWQVYGSQATDLYTSLMSN